MEPIQLTQYVVDAFTDTVFRGNPAAVCVLSAPLPSALMQSIAKENNLSETAFVVKSQNRLQLRWFTPGGEIDLCGHATLASAFVLLNTCQNKAQQVTFFTKSGELTVKRKNDLYEMDFPAYSLQPVAVTDQMVRAIGAVPETAYLGRDLLCVFKNADTVRTLRPDLDALKQLDGLLLHATALSDKPEFDCISRSFAPKLQVAEDPVCGSGHCHIIPYWSQQLKKADLTAYQASARGGVLYCHMQQSRVLLAGKAALYCRGELFVPNPAGME